VQNRAVSDKSASANDEVPRQTIVMSCFSLYKKLDKLYDRIQHHIACDHSRAVEELLLTGSKVRSDTSFLLL
jgi:hypothetical protein